MAGHRCSPIRAPEKMEVGGTPLPHPCTPQSTNHPNRLTNRATGRGVAGGTPLVAPDPSNNTQERVVAGGTPLAALDPGSSHPGRGATGETSLVAPDLCSNPQGRVDTGGTPLVALKPGVFHPVEGAVGGTPLAAPEPSIHRKSTVTVQVGETSLPHVSLPKIPLLVRSVEVLALITQSV